MRCYSVVLLSTAFVLSSFAFLSNSAVAQIIVDPPRPSFALAIPDVTGSGFVPATMNVVMWNVEPVQGFVIAIEHSSSVEVIAVDVSGVATAAGAELVVGEIFPGESGFTLGVVLDASPPFDGQTIPPGSIEEIAEFVVQPLAVDTSAAFTFVDGTLNDPVLSNVLVVDGLSIGVGQGLLLGAGTLDIPVGGFSQLTIEDTSISSAGCGAVRILLDSDNPVQGYVLAIGHDDTVLSLDDITVAGTVTAAAGAEFIVPNISPGGGSGGTLGVVLDFDAPFDGQTISPGAGLHLTNFVYCCNQVIEEPSPPQTTLLEFVNGVFGSPPLDTVIVVSGGSVTPVLVDGTVSCQPIVPAGDVAFYCGDESGPGEIVGLPGETVSVCFYYSSEAENIQGFQIAVCFDCNLTFGDFSIEGSIAEAVGAEFVNYTVDNDDTDGDGCEFVAGILLDALPPFEGQTVPQSSEPLLLGCVDATISSDPALCDTFLTVEFCNGINGGGAVEIENIAVIYFESFQDIGFVDCAVYVAPVPTFIRGDCNTDEKVDLADAASVIGQQFGDYVVYCDDACDANDDGKVNLADSVFLLNYIFKSGEVPPDPGPDLDEGPDPTEDTLGCETAACAP